MCCCPTASQKKTHKTNKQQQQQLTTKTTQKRYLYLSRFCFVQIHTLLTQLHAPFVTISVACDKNGSLTNNNKKAKLPLDKISGPSGDGIAEDAAGLQEIGEVDEDDAEALNTLEAEREAAAAAAASADPGISPQAGTVMTLKRKRKSYANPIMTAKAEKVVDEAYADLEKKPEEALSLAEFMALCEGSGVADYFAPF